MFFKVDSITSNVSIFNFCNQRINLIFKLWSGSFTGRKIDCCFFTLQIILAALRKIATVVGRLGDAPSEMQQARHQIWKKLFSTSWPGCTAGEKRVPFQYTYQRQSQPREAYCQNPLPNSWHVFFCGPNGVPESRQLCCYTITQLASTIHGRSTGPAMQYKHTYFTCGMAEHWTNIALELRRSSHNIPCLCKNMEY